MLTPQQKKFLSEKAHSLEPVVLIGKNGLTPAVLKEIDVALKSHELVKIRFQGGEKEEREEALGQICSELSAHPVKHIGKMLVVYRAAEKPKIVLPRA
ncbi:MAG: ribosome assembly RNA-binding protein YhbY [Burkholderiales bacterium]|nr:ribosome assembly RNA-binding protein YhbY [Burkholderiales bacterium]